ncbi:MAG: hypothetical protein Q8P18_26855 [Pseudomonadota bacterium]|nr:hypothetical protein [Pseudomonadota bacterium]
MNDDATFRGKLSTRLPRDLLARLEDVKATPEQLARAATLEEDDLRKVVEAVERWPWLMASRPKV